MRERVDLELDLYHVTQPGPGPRDRLRYAAACDEVVVLDQYGIVEAEPVIEPAAASNRIFFKHTQTRRRLSRADDARFRAGYGIDERTGRGCDA